MSTRATNEMRELAKDWEDLFTSAQFSGIVGDPAHEKRGGFHLSREDNPVGNYSIVRPDDKLGPDDVGAAIDMTMNAADMKTCTERLVKAYENTGDPRRKYINAFNGWTGTGGARRWDVYARKISSASSDHTEHVHLEIRRRYVESKTAMKAIFSLLRGQPMSEYLASISVALASPGSIPNFPGVLSRNDHQVAPDPAVRLLQRQLLKRGLTSAMGPADGFFGAKLETAVKAWQRKVGLTADGVVGAQTWPTAWTFKG